MQYYKISHDIAQATLNYLTQKPYREVSELITALMGLEPIKGPPEITLVKKEEKGEGKSN